MRRSKQCHYVTLQVSFICLAPVSSSNTLLRFIRKTKKFVTHTLQISFLLFKDIWEDQRAVVIFTTSKLLQLNINDSRKIEEADYSGAIEYLQILPKVGRITSFPPAFWVWHFQYSYYYCEQVCRPVFPEHAIAQLRNLVRKSEKLLCWSLGLHFHRAKLNFLVVGLGHSRARNLSLRNRPNKPLGHQAIAAQNIPENWYFGSIFKYVSSVFCINRLRFQWIYFSIYLAM